MLKSLRVVLCAWVFVVGACSGADEEQPASPEGAACQTALDCNLGSGFECIAGECGECVLGEPGCPCRAGARCEAGFVCGSGNVCVTPSCTLGAEGCACTPTGACLNDSLHCSGNTCVTAASECTPGERDCECLGGSCSPGLRCLEGRVCADSTGHLGGACFADGSCFSGNRCERDTCVACQPGTQGCTCDADNCGDGLDCRAGLCIASIGFSNGPVTEPTCYTPCSDDLTDSNGFHACQEGLMEGCFGGLSCSNGQCLATGSEPRSCTLDIDCPDFQACLAGFCASNCENDQGCIAGAVCDRRVCRKSCSIDDDACPVDHHCDLEDGVTGVCMQDDSAQGGDEPSGTDRFAVTADTVLLSSANPETAFTLANTRDRKSVV